MLQCKTCKNNFLRKGTRDIYCSKACQPLKQYWITYKDKLRKKWRAQGYHSIIGQLDGIQRDIVWLTNCRICKKELTGNRRKFCSKKCSKKWDSIVLSMKS